MYINKRVKGTFISRR